MLRIPVIIIAAAALTTGLSNPAAAIDVKAKSDSGQTDSVRETKSLPVRSFQTAPAKQESGLLDKLKRQVREVKPATGQQQYDGFIDADHDGVDDRIAKKAKVQEETEKTDKVEKAKPSTATPEPKLKSKKAAKPEEPPR